MLNKIVNKTVDQFVLSNIVKSKERSIYEYGLKNGIILIGNLLTILLIGVVTGYLEITFIFMMSYVPLRTYAGGYHAKGPVRCYIISVVIAVGVIAIVLVLGEISIFWSIPFALLIYILSPVEAPKKKLTNRQKLEYHRMTAIILMILSIVCIIAQFGEIVYVKETIIVAQAIMCILEGVGYVINKHRD